MDEARRVLERLDRIDGLRQAGAEPPRLLGELRELLHEGEAWLVAEGSGLGRARAVVGELERKLSRSERGEHAVEEVVTGRAPL